MAMMTNTVATVIQNGSQVFMTPPTLDGEEGEEREENVAAYGEKTRREEGRVKEGGGERTRMEEERGQVAISVIHSSY